ncbi:ComF family protein [Paenibacillus sp. YYML68]|uniref:ComF family protein n=1 Tax=Paenibacillus sp. YYML68 TaxID=2909250 RepID=UPI0024900952|nr:ComF family protein [Paenibacillus sp. YYML68]
MGLYWLEAARGRLGQLIHQVERWLAPVQQCCLVCGKARNGSVRANRLPLCSSCYEAIPWIHQVQCLRCGRGEVCPDCRRERETFFSQSRSAVRYDERMKEWLALYKYRGMETLAEVLGPMLMHAYHLHRTQPMASEQGVAQEFITYVPLSSIRYGERGFNQAEQMAVVLGRLTRVPVVPLLVRTRHTEKQSFKGRYERMADMRGIFAVDMRGVEQIRRLLKQPDPIRVYVIDDVYTTGSTLNECANVLRALPGVEVRGITWAR